jgi:hypothetical protein
MEQASAVGSAESFPDPVVDVQGFFGWFDKRAHIGGPIRSASHAKLNEVDSVYLANGTVAERTRIGYFPDRYKYTVRSKGETKETIIG